MTDEERVREKLRAIRFGVSFRPTRDDIAEYLLTRILLSLERIENAIVAAKDA